MFDKMIRCGVLAAASLVLAPQAHPADFTLRIGAGHPTSLGFVGVADTYFIPEVTQRAKAMGHNIRFIKAYAGTVAKVDGLVEAVQKGTLDIALQATTFDTERGALFNFSSYVPFTSSDYALQQKVANRMLAEVPELRDSMKRFGIHVLNMSVFEDYGIMSKQSSSRSTTSRAKSSPSVRPTPAGLPLPAELASACRPASTTSRYRAA